MASSIAATRTRRRSMIWITRKPIARSMRSSMHNTICHLVRSPARILPASTIAIGAWAARKDKIKLGCQLNRTDFSTDNPFLGAQKMPPCARHDGGLLRGAVPANFSFLLRKESQAEIGYTSRRITAHLPMSSRRFRELGFDVKPGLYTLTRASALLL